MAYQCRCRKCGARRSLARHPDNYIRDPKCKKCGGPMRLDKTRIKLGSSDGRKTCHCDAYHFPHKMGSSVWCIYHSTGPNQEQMKERYGAVCVGRE